MAKLTEAQKRKNFEATVGSSENDMGPLRKDLKAYEDEIMSRPEMKARKNYLEDDRANYQVRKMLAPKDKRVMIPGTVNEADTSSGRLSVMPEYKKGGAVKKMSSGGSVGSASKRADGIAVKGKTRGKIC
jgi:hypothetical protein